MRRAKNPPAFHIPAVLRQAWKLIRLRPGFILLGFLFYIAVRAFFSCLAIVALRLFYHFRHHLPSNAGLAALALPFLLLGFVVSMGVWLGWLRGLLRIARGGASRWGDLASGFPVLGKGLGTACLFFPAVLLGSVLFVIPGVLWLVRFSQSFWVVADQRQGPLDALRRSAALTAGARKELFFLFLTLLGFNILGFCLLLVGTFLSVPFSAVTLALVYEILRQRAEKGV